MLQTFSLQHSFYFMVMYYVKLLILMHLFAFMRNQICHALYNIMKVACINQ